MEKLEMETVETETGNGNWKENYVWQWKLEMETGNVRAHCGIDLAGGPLSKEAGCVLALRNKTKGVAS